MQGSAFTAMILPVWFSAYASPDVLLSIDERARVSRQVSGPGS
jgi:hypothetical protein